MVEWKSTAVAVSGTVSGRPESVAFSGRAQIQSRLALDPEDKRRAKILLQIDLGGVSGVGASTRAAYLIEAQEVITRSLAPADVIEMTFPFHASNTRAVTSSPWHETWTPRASPGRRPVAGPFQSLNWLPARSRRTPPAETSEASSASMSPFHSSIAGNPNVRRLRRGNDRFAPRPTSCVKRFARRSRRGARRS